MELAAVGEEVADLAVGGLARGAGVAESDQQRVFLQVIALRFERESVVLAGPSSCVSPGTEGDWKHRPIFAGGMMSLQGEVFDAVKQAYEQNRADYVELNERLQVLQETAATRLTQAGEDLSLHFFPCLLCECHGYSRDPAIPSTGCICNDPAHAHRQI
ncbi:hypothetical protein QBC31_40555 [Streptomyces sp. B21-079]|uniref:hypothetical protein n=1 Tax=Streptomyces sp. B21-079 TaxID=3039409 RepID=UPI002FF07B6C